MPEELAQLFDVAKKVSEQLDSLPKEERAKVLRWVAESLDINLEPQPSHAPPPPPISGEPALPPSPPHRAKDIKTFLDEKQPKSDNQYAAAVAYFYRFEAPAQDRLEIITAETLQDAARLAGRSRLGNPGATLNNAMNQGYLDRVDPGQFKISTVGENLVAMTLPSGDGNSAAPKKRASRKKTSTKKKTTKKKPTKKKAAKKTTRKKS